MRFRFGREDIRQSGVIISVQNDIILSNTQAGVRFLEGLELAHKVVDIASDKQASDIVLLDTKGICSFTDYFVICTGESIPQIKAIVETVTETLKKDNTLPLHEEGTPESGWVLLDYGDVVVHIFGSFQRDYYQLEKFWEKACTKVRVP
jgi:ribosome-associated protein